MSYKLTDLFDPECYELAKHFAQGQGEGFTDREIKDLAVEIQDAVEEWFSDRNARDGHE